MGSSQPRDGNVPFGYNFDPDDLFLRAPTPPPGDPLLSNDDSRLLNIFFEDMTSNQYPISYGEGLNFGDQWMSQLPPSYLGHTTSFGQQPPQTPATSIHGTPAAAFQDVFNFGPTMMPPPPQPALHQPQQHLHRHQHQQHQQQQQQLPSPHTPIEQNVHADVAAVLTALHNGHQNGYPPRTNSLNRGANMLPTSTMGDPINQARPLPRNHISPERHENIRPSRLNEADTLFTNMMFEGRQGSNGQRQVDNGQTQVEAPGLQWGSDSTFGRAQGFVPPDHESSEELERRRMSFMKKALVINKSAAPTRAPSPQPHGESSSSSNEIRDTNTNGHVKEEDSIAAPRKRRKSKAKEEGDEERNDLSSIPPKAAAKKRKSKADLNGPSDTPSTAQDTPGKRRKSALSAAKSSRENLSDAQKRENHIKSEQKRRGAIKEGFDDLNDIVPNLKGGGYSKSTVLTLAGNWLEALLTGNEEISQRL